MGEPKKIEDGTAELCPFCGAYPEIQPWHGGAKTKRLIGCSNEYCFVAPGVTGRTRRIAINHWNRRDGVRS